MAALEDLPPDQRAALELVLERGRSYEQIAAMLAIEPAAVRSRALRACVALADADVRPGPESALVCDYLLGQLPDLVAAQVHEYLGVSATDRRRAACLARSLAPLAATALPEVPEGAAEQVEEPWGSEAAPAIEPAPDAPTEPPFEPPLEPPFEPPLEPPFEPPLE